MSGSEHSEGSVQGPEPAGDGDPEGESFVEELPSVLQPVYHGLMRFQAFREKYSERYVWVLEAIVAVTLTVGYVYWLYLYFLAG